MKPFGYAITWPSGNVTACVGSVPPSYRGATVDPLWRDPPLGTQEPNYEAAADLLSEHVSSGELGAEEDRKFMLNLAKSIVDAALKN